VCVDATTPEQIAFAGRLPDGALSRGEAERNLTLRPPSNCTNDTMYNRRRAGGEEALRYRGFPNWINRMVLVGLNGLWHAERRR